MTSSVLCNALIFRSATLVQNALNSASGQAQGVSGPVSTVVPSSTSAPDSGGLSLVIIIVIVVVAVLVLLAIAIIIAIIVVRARKSTGGRRNAYACMLRPLAFLLFYFLRV
jgi:hypothetical protein